MKLFFGQIFPKLIINQDEQQHILKVLRLKEGENVFITDGEGNLAEGNLAFEGKKVGLSNIKLTTLNPNFNRKLHIAIAPTKNIDRIEFFLEKAVELGVSEISFLQTEKSERKNINLERLEKQAIAASKQSLRFYFPKINPLVKFSSFIENLDSEKSFVAHCHENLERISLKSIGENSQLTNCTFLIGPEGDFSDKEIEILSKKDIKAVSLGKQRLRTETAGIFVAAWNYELMM